MCAWLIMAQYFLPVREKSLLNQKNNNFGFVTLESLCFWQQLDWRRQYR